MGYSPIWARKRLSSDTTRKAPTQFVRENSIRRNLGRQRFDTGIVGHTHPTPWHQSICWRSLMCYFYIETYLEVLKRTWREESWLEKICRLLPVQQWLTKFNEGWKTIKVMMDAFDLKMRKQFSGTACTHDFHVESEYGALQHNEFSRFWIFIESHMIQKTPVCDWLLVNPTLVWSKCRNMLSQKILLKLSVMCYLRDTKVRK